MQSKKDSQVLLRGHLFSDPFTQPRDLSCASLEPPCVCWRRIRMKGKSCNEKVTEICDNNEIMRLKWMKNELECRSERICIHVGFYVMYYIWSREVRWWASPPPMDLSPCTRVYIQGGRWVSNWSGFCPYDLVLSYRFLSKDRWIFSGWCGGYPTWNSSMISWRVSHLLGSALCQILEKIRKILVVPVCHHRTPAIGYLANRAS